MGINDLKANKKIDVSLEDWSPWSWASGEVARPATFGTEIVLPTRCETSFDDECMGLKYDGKSDAILGFLSLMSLSWNGPACVINSGYSLGFCFANFGYMLTDWMGDAIGMFDNRIRYED